MRFQKPQLQWLSLLPKSAFSTLGSGAKVPLNPEQLIKKNGNNINMGKYFIDFP
jgi:hypothetical protein